MAKIFRIEQLQSSDLFYFCHKQSSTFNENSVCQPFGLFELLFKFRNYSNVKMFAKDFLHSNEVFIFKNLKFFNNRAYVTHGCSRILLGGRITLLSIMLPGLSHSYVFITVQIIFLAWHAIKLLFSQLFSLFLKHRPVATCSFFYNSENKENKIQNRPMFPNSRCLLIKFPFI